MDGKTILEGIPSHLFSTHQMVKRAFPKGIEEEAYLPLLALLSETMSIRNLAEVIARVSGRETSIVFHDILRAQSTDIPNPETLNKIKQRLLQCGYQDWLREE